MRLLMRRLDHRRALLYHGARPWTRLLGIPATVGSLPKGCYGLRLGFTEEKGWQVEVVSHEGNMVCRIVSKDSGEGVPLGALAPVARYGRGAKFSKLALRKLLDRLGRFLDEDWQLEVLELPPRNRPERWRLAN